MGGLGVKAVSDSPEMESVMRRPGHVVKVNVAKMGHFAL